jgi:hypothetical protein
VHDTATERALAVFLNTHRPHHVLARVAGGDGGSSGSGGGGDRGAMERREDRV